MTDVAVLGAGSWGTTLANLLAAKGERVRLWAYEPEVVESVNRRHENVMFLPGVRLADHLRAFEAAEDAVNGAQVVLSASPSHAVRAVVSLVREAIAPDTLIVS